MTSANNVAKRGRGRPKNPVSGEALRIKRSYAFTTAHTETLGKLIASAYPLPQNTLEVLIRDATEAARAFAGGHLPLVAAGRDNAVPTKILLHECSEAMKRATRSGAIWARAKSDGGGESDAVGLGRIIIETVTGAPYPFDLRGMIDSARDIAIEG